MRKQFIEETKTVLLVIIAMALVMLFASKAFADWRGVDYGDTTRWTDNSGNTVRCSQYGDITRCS